MNSILDGGRDQRAFFSYQDRPCIKGIISLNYKLPKPSPHITIAGPLKIHMTEHSNPFKIIHKIFAKPLSEGSLSPVFRLLNYTLP